MTSSQMQSPILVSVRTAFKSWGKSFWIARTHCIYSSSTHPFREPPYSQKGECSSTLSRFHNFLEPISRRKIIKTYQKSAVMGLIKGAALKTATGIKLFYSHTDQSHGTVQFFPDNLLNGWLYLCKAFNHLKLRAAKYIKRYT